MGISIGMVGLGQFGRSFANLFRAHPAVDRIALCDHGPAKLKAMASHPGWETKFNPRDMYDDLDDLLRSDVEAVAIFTQPWLHAPQCIRAMEAGKHVYCAVPMINLPDGDEMLDWCERIVDACLRTGQSFMMGETTYYRPQTMFCRRKAAEGAFGHFVYAEGEYFHDVDSALSLRDVGKARMANVSGRAWLAKKEEYLAAGVKDGPMHYPTHSTSGPVSVMGAHATKVTCYGYANRNDDPFFADSAFSNEVALFQMSNGATMRVCEFRELAGNLHEPETFRIIGTRGTFVEGIWKENFRTDTEPARLLEESQPTVEEMRDPLPADVAEAFAEIAVLEGAHHEDFTMEGHGGSHPYLVHEFVDAITTGRQPAVNAWEAARYTIMGIMAHKSALRCGETLDVPDLGDAPGA